MTPFFADTGFHPRTGFEPQKIQVENIGNKSSPEIRNTDDIAKRMDDIIENLKINATWMQESQMRHANKHRSDAPLFKIGDLVYVDTRNWRTERSAKKLDDKYAGPWKVMRVIPGSKAIKVDLPESLSLEGMFNVFHPNLLRLYIPNPIPLQDPPKPKPVKIVPNPNSKDGQDEYLLVDEVVDCKRFRNKWKYRVKLTGDPKYQWKDEENWINHYDAWFSHWKYPNKPKPPNQKTPKNWLPKKEERDSIKDIAVV
ncbi:hypothetical protein K3495_g14062 [Podosphaera aphanis]|nr:hypothetical protein K3495_g14062 [Podosphaera aphanis]